MPAGRPKSNIEMEIVAAKIPKELGARLNRYVDLVTSRGQGAKASKNSVIGFALAYFLDAKDKERASIRPALPQVKPLERLSPYSVTLLSPRRKKILALLQEHPEGLSPTQAKQLLEGEKNVRDVMKGMEQSRILTRIDRGLYVISEEFKRYETSHEAFKKKGKS